MSGFAREEFSTGFTRRRVCAGAATALIPFIPFPLGHSRADESAPSALSRGGPEGPSATQVIVKAVRPPEFRRWPPHSPSARYHFASDALKKYVDVPENVFLDDVADTADTLGYPGVFYFSLAEGGSALALPFERIDDDGKPLRDDRFNLDVTYTSYLIGHKPITRRIRSIVFFLTPKRLYAGQHPPTSFAKLRAALQAGIPVLDASMQFAAIAAQHRLTAFFYEFHSENVEDLAFVPNSKANGDQQLKESGFSQ
jgi:hypothetical protein